VKKRISLEEQIKSESEDQIVMMEHKALTIQIAERHIFSASYNEKDVELLGECQKNRGSKVYQKNR
jgi:hypothetical protein